MNARERVLTALRGEQPDRVPFVEGGIDLPIQRALVGQDVFIKIKGQQVREKK